MAKSQKAEEKAKANLGHYNEKGFTVNAKVRQKKARDAAIDREIEEAKAEGRLGDVRTLLSKKDGCLELTPEGKRDRQGWFLQGYLESGTVTGGCRYAGISRFTYYRWLAEDPEFKEAAEKIPEMIADDLEEVAVERAKEKSDLLLIFTLKRFRPEYRDNFKPEGGGKVEEEASARDEIERRLQRTQKALLGGSNGNGKEPDPDDRPDSEADDDSDITDDLPKSRKRAR